MNDTLKRGMWTNLKLDVLDYSVVVPIFNEEGNVADLHKEIVDVMKPLGKFEVIYVNDGSTDGTMKELMKLKKKVIIDLNRNYGQATALDAGFKASKGEIVISMDGDLQNDPRDIPKMLKKLEDDDLDVVAGWRKHRKDKTGIKILTRTGRFLRSILIKDKVHDTGCTLRVYRREAVKSLDLWGEMHRYILALLSWKGFKVGEIVVNHRARTRGVTKYGYDKMVKGFIDLVYIWFIKKYSNRPLHAFGILGLGSFGLGVLAEIWMIYQKIFQNIDLSNNAWFPLGFFLMLMGVLFFVSGIILDLLLRTYFNTSRQEQRYYVQEIREK
ncbi:MAG: glycosyltransferase family 2 protein [Nanoarchaeota archaeon]|nr:glycosyltransferase family 2 protein [Nanoarchaeota archaeon]